MRYVGRISEWNDDRGFGFVTPNGGGDRAFVHIKAFGRASIRPVAGTLVSYELAKDEKGRLNASGARFVAQQPKNQRARRRTGTRTIIGSLFLILLMLGWLVGKIPSVVALAYAVMSVAAIVLYGIDKSAARNNRWRTQESTLHVAALIGAWPGALIAQDLFRHKSRKTPFQVVFWTTVVLNCAGIAWLLASGHADALDRVFRYITSGG